MRDHAAAVELVVIMMETAEKHLAGNMVGAR